MTVRDELLSIRSRIDALLNEMAESPKREVVSARFMTVPDFAALRNYSTRTIRNWCELGMPHSGTGRGRRIHVREAIAWIEAGGPKQTRIGRKDTAA
ncbi:MAG: helix-turn-helix domain-containing protein [Myxococcota bacterium]